MSKQNYFLPVFSLVVFFDQLSKFIVTALNFSISYNSGISFSVFALSDPKLLTFTLFVAVFFVFNFFRKYWLENSLAAGFFFGGAVANIFDRLFFDSVRDWIYIPFAQVHNNLADWAIFVGLFLLVNKIVTNKTVK